MRLDLHPVIDTGFTHEDAELGVEKALQMQCCSTASNLSVINGKRGFFFSSWKMKKSGIHVSSKLYKHSTFWLVWGLLGVYWMKRNGLYWAAYNKYNIVNISKWQNILFFNIFLLKHKKSNKSMKIVGYLTLFFVKLMHWSGIVEVVTILSELSRCLLEISHEILLFPYFILES